MECSGELCDTNNGYHWNLPVTSNVTQFGFLEYLQLEINKTAIQARACYVSIQGSKCSICKREFKCITDTQKHVKKKHKYLKRKADDKLVRIKLKMGKETFCDNTISKKFLLTPRRRSDGSTGSAHRRDDSQPLQVSNIPCLHKRVPENASPQLVAQLAVPLSAALVDIKSLDQSARYKNGRIYKEQSPDSGALTIDQTFTTEDQVSCTSDATWDLNTASASDSESNTVIYVSDVERDLSEHYEDVKPQIPLVELCESDIEDAETVVLPNASGEETLDISLKDLEDLEKTCEDMEVSDIRKNIGMSDYVCSSVEQLEIVCKSLGITETIERGRREAETIRNRAKDAEITQKCPMETDTTRNSLKETKITQKRPMEVDTTRNSPKAAKITQKRPKEADTSRNSRKETEVTQKRQKEAQTTKKRLREAETHEKLLKEAETHQKLLKEAETHQKLLKEAETHQKLLKEAETYQKLLKEVEIHQEGLREAETRQKRLKEAEIIQRDPREAEIIQISEQEAEIIYDGLEESRIAYRSLEDVEKVRERLEASGEALDDLKDLEDIGECLGASEDTYYLTVKDDRDEFEGLEEGDHDVYIVEDDEEHSEPQLEDFLKAAVLKYVQECNAGSKAPCDKNNNDKYTDRLDLKNSSKFNYHLKNALMRLGITIASPSVVENKPDL